MATTAILGKPASFRAYILQLTLFRLACEYDGIELNARFAVFSRFNPWAARLDAFRKDGVTDCFRHYTLG